MADRTKTPRSTPPPPLPDQEEDLTLPPAIPPGPGPVVAGRSGGAVEGRAPAPAPKAHGNGRPADPESMKREIEATRARISGTLDAIEGRLVLEKRELVRKKDELWAKATLQGFRRKVSEEPFRSMAIAFVAGYIIAAIRD